MEMEGNIDKDVDVIVNDKVFKYFYRKVYRNERDYNKVKRTFTKEELLEVLVKFVVFMLECRYKEDERCISVSDRKVNSVKEVISVKKVEKDLEGIFNKYKLPTVEEYYVGKDNDEDVKCNNVNYSLIEGIDKCNNNNNISLLSNSNQLFNNKTTYINNNNNVNNTSYHSSYLKVNYNPHLINNTFHFNLHSPLKHKYILFNEASLSFNAHNLISVPNGIHTTTTHNNHYHPLLNYKTLSNPNKQCNVKKPLEYIISPSTMVTNVSVLTSHHPNKQLLKSNKQMIYMNDIACNTYKVKGSFDKKDLVERLFECPSDKYVVLSSEEAGKVGGMLIELMRKENELKKSLEMSNLKIEKMNEVLNEYKSSNGCDDDNNNNNGVNVLRREMEMKKEIVERYVKELESKIEESKNMFESNYNYEIDNTEINEIQNEILNEINKDLQILNT
jgi:hypothetical protein